MPPPPLRNPQQALDIPETEYQARGGQFTREELERYRQGANERIDGFARPPEYATKPGDSPAQAAERARVNAAFETLADPEQAGRAYREFELQQLGTRQARLNDRIAGREEAFPRANTPERAPRAYEALAAERDAARAAGNAHGVSGSRERAVLAAGDTLRLGTEVPRSADRASVLRIPDDQARLAQFALKQAGIDIDLDAARANGARGGPPPDLSKPRLVQKGGQRYLELPPQMTADLKATKADGFRPGQRAAAAAAAARPAQTGRAASETPLLDELERQGKVGALPPRERPAPAGSHQNRTPDAPPSPDADAAARRASADRMRRQAQRPGFNPGAQGLNRRSDNPTGRTNTGPQPRPPAPGGNEPPVTGAAPQSRAATPPAETPALPKTGGPGGVADEPSPTRGSPSTQVAGVKAKLLRGAGIVGTIVSGIQLGKEGYDVLNSDKSNGEKAAVLAETAGGFALDGGANVLTLGLAGGLASTEARGVKDIAKESIAIALEMKQADQDYEAGKISLQTYERRVAALDTRIEAVQARGSNLKWEALSATTPVALYNGVTAAGAYAGESLANYALGSAPAGPDPLQGKLSSETTTNGHDAGFTARRENLIKDNRFGNLKRFMDHNRLSFDYGKPLQEQVDEVLGKMKQQGETLTGQKSWLPWKNAGINEQLAAIQEARKELIDYTNVANTQQLGRQQIIKRYDRDQDGKLTARDFDSNNDGKLTGSDLAQIYEEKMNDPALRQSLRESGIKFDGSVTVARAAPAPGGQRGPKPPTPG